MAKQRNIGSGVVAAAREVSAIQGKFQDVGSQFMTGFNISLESKRKKEAENKAIQDRTNNYISQFDSYVDLVDYSDSEKSLVKNTVVGYRNEFANAANELAKISDMSSPRAMELQDTMNGVRSKMERLRGNLEGLAKLKVEYVENFDKHKYSQSSKNTDNILKANAIVEGQFTNINEDGSLGFDGYSVPVTQTDGSFKNIQSDAFTYSTKSFKRPFEVAKAEAKSIINLADNQAVAKGPMLDHVKKNIELQVGEILSSDDVLYSILSNSELQLIPLDSIDPDDPNAREKAIQMVTQAIVDTRGTGLLPSDKDSKDSELTSAQKDYQAAVNRAKEGFNARVPFYITETIKVIPSGSNSWKVKEYDPVEKVWTDSDEPDRKTIEGLIGLIPIS